MKPLHHPLVFGPGHRTPATLLAINERDKLLIEARRFFPGASDREVARRLHAALSTYRDGRWRRDRVEAACPVQYRGTLTQSLWLILKTRDFASEMTIRRALAFRDPRDVIGSTIEDDGGAP